MSGTSRVFHRRRFSLRCTPFPRTTKHKSCTSSPVSIHRCGYLIKHLSRATPRAGAKCQRVRPFSNATRREPSAGDENHFRPQNPTSCYRHFATLLRDSPMRRVVGSENAPITPDHDTRVTFPAICRDF